MSENLEYVLKFALEVIEDNELQNTTNKDNWKVGKSIEDEIKIIDKEKNEQTESA